MKLTKAINVNLGPRFLFFCCGCMIVVLMLSKEVSAKEEVRRTYYPNGKVRAEAVFVNGKRNGKFTAYKEDGSVLMVAQFKDNKRIDPQTGEPMNGWFYLYHDDGSVFLELQYLDGWPVGEIKNYYKNGQLMEVRRFDTEGARNGYSEKYYQDGTKREVQKFDGGVLKEIYTYDQPAKEKEAQP